MGSKESTQQEKKPPSPAKVSGGAAKSSSSESPSKVRAFGQYFEDAKTELGKVSWPTKQEIKATSIAVLILVTVMSVLLGIVDLVLTKIVEAILSIGL